MADGQYTSQERVYVDKDGNRVDAKDPKRHKLLVAAGGSIPMEDARRAGLLSEEGESGQAADDSENADDGEDAIDAAEESARIQGTAGGADSAKTAPKKAARKSASKK